MLKKLTKVLSLLLILCLMVSMFPVVALADEGAVEPVVTETPEETTPVVTPVPEESPVPSETPAVEESPVPSETPAVEESPVPSETPTVEESPAPSEAPADSTPIEDVPAADGSADFALPKDKAADEEEEKELTPEDIYALIPALYTGRSSGDAFYKIVHVDCGRKYFSPENIKKIIDNAAAAGFNQVELYLSDNQGFRFALDDMNVTTSTGNTYDLTPALGDGYTADGKCPDGSGQYLTQSEMTDIISYAADKGIDIVPCINVPGHMGAILEEFSQFKYSRSNSSIDLENAEAVAFALAITEKYATYFESQGVKYYNLGADEYANDLSTMGFQGLYTSGKYVNFVNFLNAAAQVVINHKMTPRAFNDGIYYNEDNTYPINSAIQVCYWSCGWNGYNLASAQYIVNQGMNVINTHGDYYWVLGNTSWQCSADKASRFDYTSFQYRTGTTGNGTISDPAGAMFCIWCDVGNANGTDGGTAVVSATADVIDAFGAVLPASESGDNGGETSITIQKDGNDVSTFSVKMGGTATLSLSDSEATATWSSSNENVATVTAVTRSVEANSVTVNPVSEGTATITATLSDGTALTTQVTVAAAGTSVDPAWDKEIVLEVGDTTQENQENVNNKGNVDRTNLDPNIATVDVDGVDAVEASTKYDVAFVSCNTLISRDTSDKWTAVNGYYYTADDVNYYPVYAKRSSEGFLFWYTYIYTWGYSTTNSTSNVTQIDTQETSSTSAAPSITVYTKSTTDGSPASTTITFTGVYPGTTYVKVGDTTYKIIVNYKQETINAVVNQNTTVEGVTGELDATKLDTSVARVSVENGTMTITGVAKGETQVTVGNTIYTIKVTEEDLSKVTPLTVEFWITNQQVTANGNTSMSIAASTDGVYSESGVGISTLVPSSGTQGGNTMVFWKGTRLASDNKQTTGGGVDKTKSGTDFVYIRYWNQSWAYSVDGLTWTNVASGDQIVAYYLQKTEVTEEITTLVSDYGNVPGYGSSLSPFVMVDYAVKYESGELTPSSFPTAKTIAFHCNYESVADLGNTVIQDGDTYYRKLGTIKAVETADYEVYMITLTPTSDTKTKTVANNATGATSYTYGGTEKVLWVDDEANLGDFADESLHYTSPSGNITYTVGGEPNIAGLEIYKNQCMLVTYYVRAKVTEDSLAVHYVDKTANQEFYSYNIAVKSGTLFNENIGLADPWKGNLANGSVTNLQNKTQTVSTDLSTMPAIGAQYRYSDYTCVQVVRSEDGKEVYLYYTFNNAHSFVVDFGLPLTITANDLNITGEWNSASVSGAQYGTATATVGAGVTYTPSQTLKGVETLQLTLTDSTGSVTHQIYIYPATTVYYEEGFASGSWTGGSTGSETQYTEVPGAKQYNYGYDAKYANETTGPSNNTQAVSSAIGEDAVFTFTGTGVDIYANCTTATGAVSILIKNSSNAIVKLLQVNTATGAAGSATTGQNVDSYSLPIASVSSLPHDTYTVTIRHSKTNADDANSKVYLDGFRVYGTLATEPKFYEDDAEDKPTYIELRDRVLKALSVTTANSQYASDIAEYTLAQVYATGQTTEGAVVISSNTSYTSENVQDLLDNGPKNEIFLRQNESLVFNVTTNREVQIGLKAVDSAVTCTVNGQTKNISSSTDMFYSVLNKTTSGNEEVQTITIQNTGEGILSITKLKICDDPGAALGELTEEDLIPALVGMGYELEPEEPVVEYADATLTVEVNGQTATLTKNGVVGESATFTAAEIEAVAQSLVPEGYELKDQAEDVTVVYGESDTVTFSAEEIPTEPEEPEQPTEPEEPEQPSKPANIISAVIRLFDKIFGSLKGLFR